MVMINSKENFEDTILKSANKHINELKDDDGHIICNGRADSLLVDLYNIIKAKDDSNDKINIKEDNKENENDMNEDKIKAKIDILKSADNFYKNYNGSHHGYNKWTLTKAWTVMTKIQFENVYGFSFIPGKELRTNAEVYLKELDEAKEEWKEIEKSKPKAG